MVGNNKTEHKSVFIAFVNGSLITRAEEGGKLILLCSAARCVTNIVLFDFRRPTPATKQ